MPITVDRINHTAISTTGTTHAADLTGSAAGKLLIVFLRCPYNYAAITAPPPGWSPLGNALTYSAWYRMADGTEGATATWGFSGGATEPKQSSAMVLSGATAAGIVGAAAQVAWTTDPPVTPAVDAPAAGSLVVSMCAGLVSAGPGTTSFAASNTYGIAYSTQATAGAVPAESRTWTRSGGSSAYMFTLAVAPSGGGGVSIPVIQHHRRMMGAI